MPTVSPIKIDVSGVSRVFGGDTEMRFRLERRGLGTLSQAAVSKWKERGRIPGEWLIALMLLARMERMRFLPLSFVQKHKPSPLSGAKREPYKRAAAIRA